jgi:hypothetical protein
MTFKQWMRDVFGPESRSARASRRGKSGQAVRVRLPRVELLEDRRMLATLLVTNTNDSGAGSLRQAVLNSVGHSGGGTGNDTIQFSASIDGGIINLTSAPLNDITTGSKMAGPSAFFINNNTSS